MSERNNALKRPGSRDSSSNTQHPAPYAIRVDSVEEDTSTAPITESNSHEDLIVRDPDEEEERVLNRQHHHQYSAVQQFPRMFNLTLVPQSINIFFLYNAYILLAGFLSVPALRNAPPRSLGKRQIVSSPAKSERMNRDNSCKKLYTRRLSQDSGIVAGRLFTGAVSKL